ATLWIVAMRSWRAGIHHLAVPTGSPAGDDRMLDELVVIYTAANAVQAHLLRNALTEAGIPAQVTNDALQVAGGELPLGWTIAPRVLVPREHEAEARRLAEQYDASLADNRQPPVAEDDAPPLTVPLCPGCGRPRTAICPFCHTGGQGFCIPEANGRAEGEEPAWLICPACDEPFQGGYLRRCEWCGHDFGDGLETPAVIAPPEVEPMNWRVTVVGIAVVVILAALLAYFASLL
ncbi:MAG: DUF2007 domain-containing protein, partial [Pirellulales bacterium]